MKMLVLKIVCVAALVALMSGCGTPKSRKMSGKGMYTNTKTGFITIGEFSLVSAPDGEETSSVDYEEDTAWLSPSTKTHKIEILLTGPNSVAQAASIVESICTGFVNVSAGKKADTPAIEVK